MGPVPHQKNYFNQLQLRHSLDSESVNAGHQWKATYTTWQPKQRYTVINCPVQTFYEHRIHLLGLLTEVSASIRQMDARNSLEIFSRVSCCQAAWMFWLRSFLGECLSISPKYSETWLKIMKLITFHGRTFNHFRFLCEVVQ
jgi:hypothetical protein